MKNNTDCIAVLKSYYTSEEKTKYNKKYVKEFLFRDEVSCRRYCIHFDRNVPYMSDTTEHHYSFFDQISEASYGKKLLDVYINEGIDPVPLNNKKKNIPCDKKYNYLDEFFVTYNIVYNEYSLIYSVQKDECYIQYNSNFVILYHNNKASYEEEEIDTEEDAEEDVEDDFEEVDENTENEKYEHDDVDEYYTLFKRSKITMYS